MYVVIVVVSWAVTAIATVVSPTERTMSDDWDAELTDMPATWIVANALVEVGVNLTVDCVFDKDT